MRSKLTKDGVFALSQYENQKSVWIEHTNTHAELCLTLEDIHEILKFMIEK